VQNKYGIKTMQSTMTHHGTSKIKNVMENNDTMKLKENIAHCCVWTTETTWSNSHQFLSDNHENY